jgi:hypothetical protein
VKTHWRRGTKRIVIGLLQLGVAALLIWAGKHGVPALLTIVGTILLITSGGVSYFSGCRALAKGRGVGQGAVIAPIALCALCAPLTIILIPFGVVLVLPLLLMPFFAVLAIFLGPIMGYSRPGRIRLQDLGRK